MSMLGGAVRQRNKSGLCQLCHFAAHAVSDGLRREEGRSNARGWVGGPPPHQTFTSRAAKFNSGFGRETTSTTATTTGNNLTGSFTTTSWYYHFYSSTANDYYCSVSKRCLLHPVAAEQN
jgi:hypothetical protein